MLAPASGALEGLPDMVLPSPISTFRDQTMTKATAALKGPAAAEKTQAPAKAGTSKAPARSKANADKKAAAVTKGHCQCRDIEYEFTGEPKWVMHCHCESCRRILYFQPKEQPAAT